MSVLKGYIKAEPSNPGLRMLVEKPKFEDTLDSMILKYSDVGVFGFNGFNTGGNTVGFNFSVGGTDKKASIKKLTKWLKENKGTALASLNIAANSAKGGVRVTDFELIEPNDKNSQMALKIICEEQ